MKSALDNFGSWPTPRVFGREADTVFLGRIDLGSGDDAHFAGPAGGRNPQSPHSRMPYLFVHRDGHLLAGDGPRGRALFESAVGEQVRAGRFPGGRPADASTSQRHQRDQQRDQQRMSDSYHHGSNIDRHIDRRVLPIATPLGYALSNNSKPCEPRAERHSSQPADFPAENLVSPAVPMSDGSSAEVQS
jgi:hypothetical protein